MALVVVGGRSDGKTTRMIQWLYDAPEGDARVLIVENEMLASLFANQHRDGLKRWQFISCFQALRRNVRSTIPDFDEHYKRVVLGVDEAVGVLQRMFGPEVGALSVPDFIELLPRRRRD